MLKCAIRSSQRIQSNISTHFLPLRSSRRLPLRHVCPNSPRCASSSSTIASSDTLENETLTLDNGHTLSYCISGSPSPSATPLLFLHGFPASRFEALSLQAVALKFNLRIISPDRPGLGHSTLDRNRKLLDYPPQIAQLVKHLALKQYRIMGGSAGGPYAVACAYALPKDALKATGVIAGMAPAKDGTRDMLLASRILMQGVRYAPSLVEWFVDVLLGRAARHPDPAIFRQKILQQLHWLPEEERKRVEEMPGGVENVIKVIKEHFRQGSKGFVDDSRVLASDWGFPLEDVKGKVWFWYGDQDRNTPARMGRDMAKRIEGSKLKVWEGNNHFGLWEKHGDEIIENLLEEE